jgi:hypothetical protein
VAHQDKCPQEVLGSVRQNHRIVTRSISDNQIPVYPATLTDDRFDNLAADIGQSVVAALEAVCEPFVVQTHQV